MRLGVDGLEYLHATYEGAAKLLTTLNSKIHRVQEIHTKLFLDRAMIVVCWKLRPAVLECQ
jgi:hypothetical protein